MLPSTHRNNPQASLRADNMSNKSPVLRKLWLLKLVPDFPYARLVTGLVLFSIFLPVFYLGHNEIPEHSTPALFFSLVLAYIIPVFSHITGRAQTALIELHPRLDLSEEEFAEAQTWLQSSPLWAVLLQLGLGALAGFAHMSYVRDSIDVAVAELVGTVTGAMSMVGAMLVWMIMVTVISMLMQQAFVFARLGARNVRIALLNTTALAPFARVSISSSLAIIGALALFPLISFESGLNLREILPGAIATLGPLIGLFFIPIWPVHRRLAAAKQAELEQVNGQLESRLEALGPQIGFEQANELAPLINYRREVNEAPTWPFEGGNMGRILLYMVIPPLTWIAAALMENLVDSML